MEKMEKKSNRGLSRRRPPNLNLKGSSSSRHDAFEQQSFSREGEEVSVIQAAGPVFASVHRPRHASISAIRREMNHPPHSQQSQQSQPHILGRSAFRSVQQQQAGPSPEFLQIPERGDNGNSGRVLRAGEGRKVGWEDPHNQSVAVPIPQPFRQQSQPAQGGMQVSGMGHHPTYYGHLQQGQGSKQSSGLAHNRIPVPQQNFNQISKTATNLLNDIYEKHLLSQTTFENVTMLNSRNLSGAPVGMPATGPFPEPGGQHQHHHHHQQHGMCSADGDFNLNNFQQKQQSIRGHNQHGAHHHPYRSHHLQHQPLVNISNHHIQQPPPQKPQQSQQPGQSLLQVAMVQQDPSQHVYETVDGPPPPASHVTGAPPGASSVPNRTQRRRPPGKVQRNGKNSGAASTATAAEGKQSNPSNQKKHVSGGLDENYFGMGPTVQQQQQQHSSNQHPLPPPPAYNHQPRTRADGENDSGPSGGHKIAHPVAVPHPVVVQGSTSSQSMPPFPLERIPTTAEPGDGIQTIRGAPIGSAAVQGDHEVSELADHFPEFNGPGTIAKFQYRNSKIDLMLETAQAMAAAAYYAKAAQKLAQSGSSKSKSTEMSSASRNGGYCGALQRAPPPIPPGLARRLANKENYGIGKVKVMLRVSDPHVDDETPHFMSVDKKKRQVTLTDPTTSTVVASTSQERGPMVAAPKMFAFDGLFTAEDQQSDVCSSALSEVIPAVLEGSDGCLLTIGYPTSGQTRTMLGAINPPSELGAIPCAISWLYKGINERRQKSGARFSVRVSALGVSAMKPDSSSKDLLAAHATDSDDSPGVYLRDDFLGGPTELRAPTAERAALFLDAALAGRPQSALEPAMIFTLHVYQYSLSRKGGVAGGRSRLHLIDLGGCANRNGGLPLSGIGNVLLAILSGQRHPPNKDHPLTPLLKDCLAPLTCHVTIMAHVSHTQSHADALTTIQLASRIHRMRRRKHRFPISSDKALGVNNAGHQSGGSSEGPDPSSSDLSADTVIYMGPCDDATDGEHPPVYLPSLSSGDNRCAMNKVLKGSGAEKPSKIPAKKAPAKSQSPVPHRTDSIKRGNVPSSSPTPPSSEMPTQPYSPVHGSPKMMSSSSSPKIVAGALRHSGHAGISKGSNVPTPKGSPLRRPNVPNPESPKRQISEEQWIDGPRVSRAKVAEARHLLREINHVKQCETWVDGPKSVASSPAKPLTAGNLPGNSQTAGYGFMDTHKKIMIRQWVENQSSHVFQSPSGSPTHQAHQQQQVQQQLRTMTYHLTQFKQKAEDDQISVMSNSEMVNPIAAGLTNLINQGSCATESSVRSGLKLHNETDLHSEKSGLSAQAPNCQESPGAQEDQEDQDSGPSEVPPALPLIEPLGSREISHESLHRIISRHVSRESLSLNQHNVQTVDCGLQVTEDEIARTMGCEHPLAALSHGDISVVSSFNIGDAFSDCAMGERTRNQFDQLARLREIFTSQLAMAEVTPAFRIGDAGSVYSEPAFRFNPGPGSVCSETAYRPPSPRCRGCRQSLNESRTPSQTSLPSLNGIMAIAGMEQYASLRHPDGASDPNLQKAEKSAAEDDDDINEKSTLLSKKSSIEPEERSMLCDLPIVSQTQLPLLPLSTSEAYDSGHDSSTPRTSKHSGISRRAESGYHSVATARDSDESSFTSAISKEHNRITMKKKRQDKSLCNWLRNPFTCTYPETEGEISDF